MAKRASSSSPVWPADLRRRRLADEYQLVIEKARLALTSIGVPDTCFAPQTYVSNFLTSKFFAKLLRTFPNFDDLSKVEELLLLGVRLKIFDTFHNLKPRVFYDFLQFLKRPQGQDEIAKLRLAAKLAKRGRGHSDAKQVGLLLSRFEVQRDKCITELNDIKRDFDGRIANLESQLRKLQAEREAAVLAVGKKYKPYSKMKFPTNRQFNIACWNEYINACLVERKMARILDADSLTEAVRTYSDVVRRKNILTELNRGSRREELEKWVLVNIGGFADAEVPVGDEEEVDGSDSSEQVEAPEQGGIFDLVSLGLGERCFRAQASDVAETQADAVPQDGAFTGTAL